MQVVVSEGGGFCNYDYVVCLFNGVEAIQSDITNDYFVTCNSPVLPFGAFDVQLRFCKDTTGDTCTCETDYFQAAPRTKRGIEEAEEGVMTEDIQKREEDDTEQLYKRAGTGLDPRTGQPYPAGLVVNKQVFNVVGVTSITPGSGSVCGDTKITLKGAFICLLFVVHHVLTGKSVRPWIQPV